MRLFRAGRCIIQVFILTCILVLPLFFISKFANSSFIEQIGKSLSMDTDTLLSCFLDYLSLMVALLLGIVAYYQTKAINELEFLKYSVFVGIESLGGYAGHQDPFKWERFNKKCSIVQSIAHNEKNLRAYVNMMTSPNIVGSGKLIHIPLVFVTKNEPLIVSVRIRKIYVNFPCNNGSVSNKKFKPSKNVYHTILNDGDHLNVSLGIIAPDTAIISTIELAFDIVVKDHHGRKHSMLVKATLSNQSDGLYLTSSHTKRLAV